MKYKEKQEFIEKVIKKYKYKDVIDFGLQLNNLKIYRDIKKELFSWNSTYANLDFFYEDINDIIKRYDNKENKKLEKRYDFTFIRTNY